MNVIRSLWHRARRAKPYPPDGALPADPNWYRVKCTGHAALPPARGAIVLLGDSLTEAGHWAELLGDSRVVNRGIGGDTIRGVKERLEHVLATSPSTVYLTIGTNNILAGASGAVAYAEVLPLLETIASATRLVVSTIPPINAATRPKANAEAQAYNRLLTSYCETHGIPVLDLYSQFSKSGDLRPELSVDGVHIAGPAYSEWALMIRQLAAKLTSDPAARVST